MAEKWQAKTRGKIADLLADFREAKNQAKPGDKLQRPAGKLTTWRITGARIAVELETNERRDVKPRRVKNWRGASALMRGLGC